jgi:hypothetical protein
MNKTRKFLGVLFEKSIVKSVANKIALGKLEKIDSRVSKKIRKKFLPLTLPNPQDSMNEYCEYIIKNFDYQILIDKEIQNETHKMGISLNVDEKIILKILKDLTRENK